MHCTRMHACTVYIQMLALMHRTHMYACIDAPHTHACYTDALCALQLLQLFCTTTKCRPDPEGGQIRPCTDAPHTQLHTPMHCVPYLQLLQLFCTSTKCTPGTRDRDLDVDEIPRGAKYGHTYKLPVWRQQTSWKTVLQWCNKLNLLYCHSLSTNIMLMYVR